MKKLLISAVLSSALLISGSLSAKTLKFQISSKAGDWAHTYLNTKNKVLEELTNGELKLTHRQNQLFLIEKQMTRCKWNFGR